MATDHVLKWKTFQCCQVENLIWDEADCYFGQPPLELHAAADYLRRPSAKAWKNRYGLNDFIDESLQPTEVLQYLPVNLPYAANPTNYVPVPLETFEEAKAAEAADKPPTPRSELAKRRQLSATRRALGSDGNSSDISGQVLFEGQGFVTPQAGNRVSQTQSSSFGGGVSHRTTKQQQLHTVFSNTIGQGPPPVTHSRQCISAMFGITPMASRFDDLSQWLHQVHSGKKRTPTSASIGTTGRSGNARENPLAGHGAFGLDIGGGGGGSCRSTVPYISLASDGRNLQL
jgi:hypothetical protein